jgi:hypothetical protein
VQHRAGRIVRLHAAREHEALQLGPRDEAVLARHARLGVVQAQGERGDGVVRLARGGRQGLAESLEGGGVVGPVACKQLLGLLLQVADVGPGGNALHVYLRAWTPMARKSGCTKGGWIST